MGNNFGTALYTVPDWVKYSGKSQHRVGKDSLDWFFRGFNKLRLYENFLRTMPRYMGFSLTIGALGSFYWSQAWDRYWIAKNKGCLYKDVPYVYPRAEED